MGLPLAWVIETTTSGGVYTGDASSEGVTEAAVNGGDKGCS